MNQIPDPRDEWNQRAIPTIPRPRGPLPAETIPAPVRMPRPRQNPDAR